MEEQLEPYAKKAKLHIANNQESLVTNVDSTSVNDDKELALSEEKYGLKLFLNKDKRISGIIKQRYTDFIVRECDEEGNLVYLTDLSHIDDTFDTSSTEIPECPITDNKLLEKIKEFVGDVDQTKTLTLDADNDKDHRKLVHKYIKSLYKHIETDTAVLEDGSRAIKLSFKCNNADKHQRKPDWLKNVPKFCHFVLYKENRGTMECINTLAKLVHTKPANFGYAGTKDRRATTIQRVSVKNVRSKQLGGLNDKLKNMAVGNFSYKDKPLHLGDLTGNKFIIMIRDLIASDEIIEGCCSSLKEKGFINYFGLQRFGTGEVPTHDIGKILLQSKFEEAVSLILQLSKDINRFEAAAKRIWHKSKNAKEALKAVKNRTSIEGMILSQLSKQEGRNSYNYYDAFMALPRNNRLMYLHSYQSIIWNNMVSRRIEELGDEPCVGDLILNKESELESKLESEIAVPLTENDILLKTFTIYDIVLPLPGYDVIYPSNKIGKYYQEVLSSDGIDIHNMKNKIKDLSLSGTYRNIVEKPKDMSWQIQAYNDYKISLVQTDLEKIRIPEETNNRLLSNTEGGKYKGLCLQMRLPTSCYATTALREVLISDSSYHSQVNLNEIFKTKDGIKEETDIK